MPLADGAQHFDAQPFRHALVADHHVDVMAHGELDRGIGVIGDMYFMLAEQRLQRAQDARLVIDAKDADRCAHGLDSTASAFAATAAGRSRFRAE